MPDAYRCVSPFVLVLAAACSGSSEEALTDGGAADGSGAASTATTAVDLVAFSRLTNSIPTYIEAGGTGGWAIVDTGNPWALLDPTVFPSAAGFMSGGNIPSIVVADRTVDDPFVFSSSTGDVLADATFNISGNVGCSVLCGFTANFDYRDVTLTLGKSTPPSGLGAPMLQTFALEGGATIDGTKLPRSRVVVDVAIEGATYSMIVDTGATDVTISAAAYAALTSDGRTQLSGGTAQTTTGASTASITRAASVSVGDAVAQGIVVAHDTSFDSNLAAVSTDVGHTIDGSLGGTFLARFYVEIDYPAETLMLTPYSDPSFILDPAEHIGLTLEPAATGYVVAAASSDATAKGVAVGDAVVAIQGMTLSSLTPLQVATLGFGKVGSLQQVTFGAAQTLSGKSISLAVEETLPLPTGQ